MHAPQKKEPKTDLQRKAEWVAEQAKTLPKALPCVFCKTAKVGLGCPDWERLDAFWVSCDHCLCQGPFGNTPLEAVEGWNTRHVS